MGRNCFVIMPFAGEFEGIWETIIRPTVEQAGDTCVRADDFFSPGVIMDDVLKRISEADYLIADLTHRNPNVFYELGIAHATKKDVLLITQEINDIPFDLAHQRVISYSDSVSGAENLRTSLIRTINSI